MLASKTKSPTVEQQKSSPTSDDVGASGSDTGRQPKKRGDLAATLDPLLKPRRAAGHPGRPRGAVNYQWTPETDRLLVELCATRGAAAAKRTIGRKILEGRAAQAEPRPDSVRKAVENRMSKLGLRTGQKRKRSVITKPRRWTEAETTTLLGALGADATIDTIAARTGHTIKSVRAKLARLDHQVNEIHGFAEYTVDELAELIHVTPRQIRRWKEKGWLQTKDRRITGPCLEQFLSEHADQIAFADLTRTEQVHLIDLGYPDARGKAFQQNVREILEGLGRDRKTPRRTVKSHASGMASGDSARDNGGDDNSACPSGQSD